MVDANPNAPVRQFEWRIGEIMIQKGWIRWPDLEMALEVQKETQKPIGDILLHQGLISSEILFESLAIQFGKKFVRISESVVSKQAVDLVPKHFVYEHALMPLAFRQGELLVAISDPLDMWPISILERLIGIRDIETALATPQDIQSALEHYYGREGLV